MSETCELMNKKLAEAFSEPWGSHGVFRPDICELVHHDDPEGISGVLRVHTRTRSGEEAVVFERRFRALNDAEAVNGFLADALSSLLASHTSWPR